MPDELDRADAVDDEDGERPVVEPEPADGGHRITPQDEEAETPEAAEEAALRLRSAER